MIAHPAQKIIFCFVIYFSISCSRSQDTLSRQTIIYYYSFAIYMPTKKTTETREETFRVNGEDLLKKVKELIREGNVRRITIKDKSGRTIIDIPMTVGVVGAVLAPPLAAVGAIAALLTECTISVERDSQ